MGSDPIARYISAMTSSGRLLLMSAVGAAFVAGAGAVRFIQADGIGSLLVTGMQLVYERDGVQTPWTIDSVVPFSATGMKGCIRIQLRTSPTQATPEKRAHCSDSATMYNWDDRLGRPRGVRPLLVNMLMEMRQQNGTLVRYEASAPTLERIRTERGPNADTTAIEVIPTVVTTMDSTGKAVRRLRERFSVGLATATGGVFEVPDSTTAGRWRTTLQFELVRIRIR